MCRQTRWSKSLFSAASVSFLTLGVLAASLAIVTCGVVRAQSTTASLIGIVRDPSGAAVPGVDVTAQNVATSFQRSTVTDDTGAYLIPNLPVGGYTVTAQKAGFSKSLQRGITLAVDQNARVDIALARLSGNDTETARTQLTEVVTGAEAQFQKLRDEKVIDAFTRTEAQPIIRAAHALGCLAYDQERYDDAVTELERVYAIDNGAVGTEARLIAGKARMKQSKAAESIAILEPAVAAPTGGGRAQMGLALAHFAAGSEAEAKTALAAALAANAHYGKAVLGRIRRHVENVAGTQAGSVEEALVYAQTYGDAWGDDAKAFLTRVLEESAQKPARAVAPVEPSEALPAAP